MTHIQQLNMFVNVAGPYGTKNVNEVSSSKETSYIKIMEMALSAKIVPPPFM